MKKFVLGALLLCPFASAQQDIEIWREPGSRLAHVIAPDSDRDAFFGAGYVCAYDRWYQMCLSRVLYEGRTAEHYAQEDGAERNAISNAELISHDKRVRVLGLRRSAQARAASLDDETRTLLQEYADGVNKFREETLSPGYIQDPAFDLNWVDDRPWTVEDCIGVWLLMADRLQGRNWGRDEWKALQAYLDRPDPALGSFGEDYAPWVKVFGTIVGANAHSTVEEGDMGHLRDELLAFANEYNIPRIDASGFDFSFAGEVLGSAPPPMSEALAIHKDFTDETLGSAILGAPRLRVVRPNTFYEWHMQGATFNVRGIGVPGCPNIICGSSSDVGWTATALALDMTDLFIFEPGPDQDTYKWGADFIRFQIDEVETIVVRDAPDEQIRVRWTELGPVVAEPGVVDLPWPGLIAYSNDELNGQGLTIKSVLHERPDQCASSAMLRMYRAKNAYEFFDATEAWTMPSLNMVMADKDVIGYTLIGAMPVRTAAEADLAEGASRKAGRIALDASPENDWQGVYVPHKYKPHVINPQDAEHNPRPQIASANNRPIGTWYPLFGLVARPGGNARYARLVEYFQENFASGTRMSKATLKRIFTDAVGSTRRDLVIIAEAMDTQETFGPESDAFKALSYLSPWKDDGAHLWGNTYGTQAGTPLAARLSGALRPPGDIDSYRDTVKTYGVGTPALLRFIDGMMEHVRTTSPANFTTEQRAIVQGMLESAWQRLFINSDGDPTRFFGQPDSAWLEIYSEAAMKPFYGFHYVDEFNRKKTAPRQGLLTLPTTDDQDLPSDRQDEEDWTIYSPLSSNGSTISDIKGAAFNQLVFPGYDMAQSMLAMGVSGSYEGIQAERDYYTDQSLDIPWDNGQLKHAKMTGIPRSGAWTDGSGGRP